MLSFIPDFFDQGVGWLVDAGFSRDVAVNLFTEVVVSILLLSLVTWLINSIRHRLRTGKLKSILDAGNRILGEAYNLVRIAGRYQISDSYEEIRASASSERDLTFSHPEQLLDAFMFATSDYLRAHTQMYQLIDISSGQLEAEDIDPLGSLLAVTGVIRTEIEEARNRLDRLVIGSTNATSERRTGIEGARIATIALARVRTLCEEVELPASFRSMTDLKKWHKRYHFIQEAREDPRRRISRRQNTPL